MYGLFLDGKVIKEKEGWTDWKALIILETVRQQML